MKRYIQFIALVLMIIMLIVPGCGSKSDTLTLEQKTELLEKELQARQIEEIDRDLTDILMAEAIVRYCYVVEQEDTVVAHIYFYPGTDYNASLKIGDKAWKLLEDKYPDHSINVIRTIEE